MELLFQTYQVSYFTNNSDVTATPPTLSMLLTHLSGFSLLPMFGQEFNALNGEKRQMVIMTSADQKFRVEFPVGSINFHAIGGTKEEFINKVEDILKVLQTVFPHKKANRLAVVNAFFYQGTEQKYRELYQRIFTHHNADPFEWENRIVEHVNLDVSGEKCNSGSAVRRCFIQAPHVNNNNPTEIINFEVDTNTVIEESGLRFDFINAGQVIKKLQDNNNRLVHDLSRYTDN